MIEHTYQDLSNGRWLVGNLHAHTKTSDGERDHQQVIDDYASRGYGFLMISDHDIYTALEDYEQYEAQGMIMVPGNEISANGPHMLHVGAVDWIEPHEDRQRVIDEVQSTGGGLVIFNHPNRHVNFNHCPQDLLESCNGYMGLEIYNGVSSRLEGSPYATNRWDMLLTQGRRVWGYAHDDSHVAVGDVGLGWNATYVKDETPTGVVEALRAGRFYASTGVEINAIEVEGNKIHIETENAERIVALRRGAMRCGVAEGREIELEMEEGMGYVRFECWGAGEGFAWTQPFFV